MNKNKSIKILLLLTMLTLSCLAWEKNFKRIQHKRSIEIPLGDYTYLGEPQVHGDVAFHTKGNKCRAFKRTCPHLGCKVEVDENNNCFFCPCHGSKFALDGNPLEGPATEKLVELKCEVDSDKDVLRIYLK